MEFTLPEFPGTPAAQAAFMAALFLAAYGLSLLAFPATLAQVFGFEARENRPGALGELRASGGFLSGLSFGVWLFNQPMPYVVLGAALAVSAFGRFVSLLSDRSLSALNVLVLLLQILLAFVLLNDISTAFADAGSFVSPRETRPALTLLLCLVTAGIGFLIMFAPRLSAGLAGLSTDKPQSLAFVRAAGAFLLGLGLFAAYLNGLGDSLFVALLLTNMALIPAFALSGLGRVLSLALNRGNLAFNLAGLAFAAGAAGILIWAVIGVF